MMARTHLMITLFFSLLLFPKVVHSVSFLAFSLFSTLLPDIDTSFSKLGKNKSFRFFQFFLKHRGFLHSFTFLFLISFLLALFFPILAFPLFLGYGLHLIADSFTLSGLRLFYPFKKIYSGSINTGTRKEIIIFLSFFILNLFLLASIIFDQLLF